MNKIFLNIELFYTRDLEKRTSFQTHLKENYVIYKYRYTARSASYVLY